MRRPTLLENCAHLRRKVATFTPLLVCLRQAVDLVTLTAAHPNRASPSGPSGREAFLSPSKGSDIVIRLSEQAIFQNTQRTSPSLPELTVCRIFRADSSNATPAGAAFDKNPCQAQPMPCLPGGSSLHEHANPCIQSTSLILPGVGLSAFPLRTEMEVEAVIILPEDFSEPQLHPYLRCRVPGSAKLKCYRVASLVWVRKVICSLHVLTRLAQVSWVAVILGNCCKGPDSDRSCEAGKETI